MIYFRKFFGIALLSLLASGAHAAMAPTAQFSAEPERAQLAENLDQREHVRRQLIEFGVDPREAAKRVSQMTDQQVLTIQGEMSTLPAGAGVSTTNLLLIVIILILIL